MFHMSGQSKASRASLAAAAVAALLGMSACSSSNKVDASGSGGHPYRVLAVMPLSGANQAIGQATKNALEVAADGINKSGGINGRRVALSYADDQADPTKAVSLLQAAISAQKPDAVVAGSSSNETLAMLPALSRAKIMNIGTTSSIKIDDPNQYPYTFRPNDRPTVLAKADAEQFAHLGYKKVALLAPDSAIGISNSGVNSDALNAVGLSSVTIKFDPAGLDMSAPVAQLKGSGAQAALVISAGPAAAGGLILDARAKVGLSSMPFYFDAGLTADITKLVPAAELANAFICTYAVSVNQQGAGATPSMKDFVAALKAKGPIVSTMLASTAASDALTILQVGADAARSTDPDKMKAALENLEGTSSGTWKTFNQIKWSSSSHFNTASQTSDYVIVPVGPLVDGQIVPSQS